MKIKNSFYFTVACLVLAYDYAWNDYKLPSLVMTLCALVLAYLIAMPSRKEVVQLVAQSTSILCIETIVFIIINQESSTWVNPILAISTIVFYGCWGIVYEKAKPRLKSMFESFITIALVGFIACFLITMIIFNQIPTIQVQLVHFLIMMLMPVLLILGAHYIKMKLSMTYSIVKKINI